jgi:hypothetical protein
MSNNKRNIITTSLAGIALLIGLGIPAAAHEGFEHVIGTVARVSGSVLTVKTARGNVDVKLDAKTEVSRGDQKVQVSDLKPGLRVVVDIPEDSKEKIAHSVKVGTPGAAPVGR